MPPDQTERTDVPEVPQETGDDSNTARAAVDSQAKPPDLIEKEQRQADLRDKRKTPSSTNLPAVQLFESAGELVAKFADKVVKLGEVVRSSSDALLQSHGPRNSATLENSSAQATEQPVPAVEIVQVDEKTVAKASHAIYEACEGKVEPGDSQVLKFLKRAGTNDEVLVKTLESLTEVERQRLAQVYQEQHNIPLALHLLSEMETPEEQEYMMRLLTRKDGEVVEKRKSKLEVERENVDRDKLKETAEILHDELGTGWTDHDKVFTTLESLSEAERDVLRPIYQETYGETLRDALESEYSGAELDRAFNVLYRKDGSSDDAARIHTALIERAQWVEGRDDEICERDIRETLATMNSDQIGQLRADYERRYGQSLEQVLRDDDNLSETTKGAIAIYLKGADARTDEDSLQLAGIALQAQDIDMYKEVMSKASPEARQAFMENDGEQRLDEAFGTKWYGYIPHVAIYGRVADAVFDTDLAPNLTDTEVQHASDYAQEGKLSSATELSDNQSWLGDNERGIEQTVANLTPEQRETYTNGRDLASGKDVTGLSDEQKVRAIAYYNSVYGQLENAGNATEIARWEDMIAHQGGTFISKLAEYDGITDDVPGLIKEIENMSVEDWSRLKGPQGDEFCKDIERTLALYLSESDVARCMEVIYIKKAMSSFESAVASGRRSTVDALNDVVADSFKFYGQNVDEKEVYRVIRDMSPEDQKKYRSDVAFKDKIDDLVTSLLDGREEDAAMHMLQNVEAGRAPGDDILSKLRIHAADTDTDEAQVIRDVITEFRQNSAVRKQLLHPASADDEAYRQQFEDALRTALGSSDFERYGRPLVDSGHLSLALQMELNKGIFDDDEQGYYRDILDLANSDDDWSKSERERIVADETYRETVLGALSEDERQVATYVLEQEEMRPEDKIRSHMIGAGTGEDEIKEVLARLSPVDKERLKTEYARKYEEDLSSRLLDELGGQDAIDSKRAIRREYDDSRSAFNETRDEYYESRSGLGSEWVDSMWDGSGYQADEAYNAFARAMAEHAARFEELPAERREELLQNLRTSVDMFRESKSGLADSVTDTAIAAACVAAGFVTEGGTWALLGALVAGGLYKSGGKAAIMGADYDWDSSAAITDFAVGGIDAALNMVTFGAGSSAARAVLKEAGKTLLKEGAAESLEKGMVSIIRQSIKDGTYKYSDDAVRELVDNLARQGADKQALERIIRQNLDRAVKEEAERTVGRLARQTEQQRPDPAWEEPGKYKFDDGTEMEVFKPGRWVQPIENIPSIPAEAKGIKAHVFTSDTADLELLQKILMRSLRDDPDLVGHVSWKTFDPKKTPDGAAVGHGQARKAFTLEASSPEELARVAKKIDDILSQHPELKPVPPEGVDQLVGRSGRVAIVRDRYAIAVDAAGNEGAALHESLADRILAGVALERDASSGKVTKESLAAVEKRLREVEEAAGLKADSLVLDKDGRLMLRPSSDHSGELDGKFYLDEHAAEIHPRGASYETTVPEVDLDGHPILDPATGKPSTIERTVRSEGLTDRPAYYRLADMYGVDPASDMRASSAISLMEATDVPPSIKAIGVRADIADEEWARRVAYINENRLALPAAREIFLRKAVDTMSKWDDQSFLNTVLEKSAADLRGSLSRYKEIVSARHGAPDGSADRELIELLDRPNEVRQLFKDDPDVQHALDEYYRARDVHAEVSRDLRGVINQRQAEVQQLFDEFADAHDLPHPELIVTDDAHMVGAYGTYGDGVIRLRESDILRLNDPLKLMETAYHEFAHSAQDNLMIRSVVDEVESQIGTSLTPDVFERIQRLNKLWVETGALSDAEMTEMVDLERAVSAVRKRYAEVSGGGMHVDHFREVVRARDGIWLTPDELERAAHIAAAWKLNAPPGDKLVKLGNDLEVTRGELRKLDLIFGEHRLIQRLIDDNGQLSRHLFGTDTPPPEVRSLMETYRHADTVPERWEQARTALHKHLGQHETDVITLCKQINKDYMKFHEQEAFVLGALLRDLANSLGTVS